MQFLIDFTNTASQAEIDQYVVDNGCTVIHMYNSFDKCFLVESNSVPPVTALVESAVRDDDAPIQLMSFPQLTFATSDDDQWWKLATFNAPDFNQPAQTYDRRGEHTTVYVVDSGVKADHPDLLGADVQSIYSFNGDVSDHNGHGTAIASVISGASCGVTSAKIRSAKIFQDGVTTLQSHILAAFDAVLQDYIAADGRFSVMNLSWSIPRNTFIENKIAVLQLAGIGVVVAAGNSGIPIEDVTPAAMNEVWTVGSYGQTFSPSSFSNYTGPISTSPGAVNGGALDSWAPGEGIRAALLNNGFGLISGTSIAAAIQSAAVAYSSDLFTLTSGLPVDSTKSINVGLGIGSRGKEGLLNLTGVYTASTNKVACFYAELENGNNVKYPTRGSFKHVAWSNQKIESNILNFLKGSNIQIANSLPNGMQLDNNWLVGAISTDSIFRWSSPMMLTLHTGDVINTEISITVVSNSYDLDSLEAGDPALQLTPLYLDVCEPVLWGAYYYCEGTCILGFNSCVDCGGNGGGAKAPTDLQCACIPDQTTC